MIRAFERIRGPRHNRRGFAVAAVLYLLGLIGVIGGVRGVLFANIGAGWFNNNCIFIIQL